MTPFLFVNSKKCFISQKFSVFELYVFDKNYAKIKQVEIAK
jgi:hypothetical protein